MSEHSIERAHAMNLTSEDAASPNQQSTVEPLGKIQIKRLSPSAILPVRTTAYSAGIDLFSPINATIPAGEVKCVFTDVAISWTNPEYYLQLHSRSGMAKNANVTVEGGVVDIDYRSNIGIILRNAGKTDYVVRVGDRIAQAVPTRIAMYGIEELGTDVAFAPINTTYLPVCQTTRKGGFGSTGK